MRMPITTGTSTACMYCSATTTAIEVRTVSVRLVTPTLESMTTGAGSPGAPGVGVMGSADGSMPSSGGRLGSVIEDDCTREVRGAVCDVRQARCEVRGRVRRDAGQ